MKKTPTAIIYMIRKIGKYCRLHIFNNTGLESKNLTFKKIFGIIYIENKEKLIFDAILLISKI